MYQSAAESTLGVGCFWSGDQHPVQGSKLFSLPRGQILRVRLLAFGDLVFDCLIQLVEEHPNLLIQGSMREYYLSDFPCNLSSENSTDGSHEDRNGQTKHH